MRLRHKPWSPTFLASHPDLVISPPTQYYGQWTEKIFDNRQPLHLEIGVGKGNFLINLAQQNPDINYIGMERSASVLVTAVQKAQKAQLKNIRFINSNADQLMAIFAKEEISKIYINFPDPWPKKRHIKRRLLASNFLNLYHHVLKEDGVIHFKTDNIDLFNFALLVINAQGWLILGSTNDLYESEYLEQNIGTEYEKRFCEQGYKINYVFFQNYKGEKNNGS